MMEYTAEFSRRQARYEDYDDYLFENSGSDYDDEPQDWHKEADYGWA